MDKVKISIKQMKGKEIVQECDIAYGCCMTRTMGEKGSEVSCLSYLTGCRLPLDHILEPIADSIINVVGELAEGDSMKEMFILFIIKDKIRRRLEFLHEEGGTHAGN